MDRCPKDEAYEEPYIPVSHTSAYPWAMMIVHFNTTPTFTAMERSWGPQNITASAI